MEVCEGVEQLPPSLPYPVVTIGNFDGIHRGHRIIFQRVVERARKTGGTAVAVTFRPHPQRVLKPEASPDLLTDFPTKLALMEGENIDIVLIIPFTRSFAQTPPKTFIAEMLHGRVGAKEIFVGHDFAFGRDRAGTIKLLETEGERLGFSVTVVGPVEWEGQTVSSSIIRQALTDGEPALAADLLGRPYSILGKVVGGYEEGRIMGFPTANVQFAPEVLLPALGVYAVRVRRGERWYDGVANIGTSPTFKDRPLRLEVHIFEFNEEIYDELLEVAFIARLREERRFSSVDELVAQIIKDADDARVALAASRAETGPESEPGLETAPGEVAS